MYFGLLKSQIWGVLDGALLLITAEFNKVRGYLLSKILFIKVF